MPAKKPDPLKEWKKLVRQAREKIEKKSRLVTLCEKRVQKWRKKWSQKKRGTPGKARAKRKILFWNRRKHDAIHATHVWKARMKKLKASKPVRGGRPLLMWAVGFIGTREGSAKQKKWANDLGYSAALPWCSIFVANGIKEVYGLPLPPSPAYSGSWMAWAHGKRVPISHRRAGDILIYDWGDGGMTDHVAIYDGKGGRVGGNQNDEVNRRPVDEEFLVGVVRPNEG